MIKVSLFAAQEREAKLDKLGHALRVLAEHIDFAALAAEIDRVAARPGREHGERPPFLTELMIYVTLIICICGRGKTCELTSKLPRWGRSFAPKTICMRRCSAGSMLSSAACRTGEVSTFFTASNLLGTLCKCRATTI
jgi:hypothetical protein